MGNLEKKYLRWYQYIDETTKEQYSQFLFSRPFSLLLQSEKYKLYQYQTDMKSPKWKYIYLYDKLTKYSVSNTGEIRNNETGEILKQKDQRGYCFINLTIEYLDKSIQRRTFSVHRLVALAFISNPDNKPEVNHNNGNKKCNWVGNLEWCTSKENIDHAIHTGIRNTIGENNARNKFSEETIHQVCQMLEQGKEATEISKVIDCSKNVIEGVKRGMIWKHISKNYDIPQPLNKTKPLELRKYMFELIMAGYSDKEVAELIGLPINNTRSVAYVNLAKRRYLKSKK
jgi:NUMOD4 motif.